MRPKRLLSAVVFGGLLALSSGCARRAAVPVTVTLDGNPVEGATVVLIVEGGAGDAGSGETGADGNATVNTPDKKGVKAGSYKVLVTKKPVMGTGQIDPKSPEYKKMMNSGVGRVKSDLPEKYGDPTKTPLTCKVPPDSSPVKLDLQSK